MMYFHQSSTKTFLFFAQQSYTCKTVLVRKKASPLNYHHIVTSSSYLLKMLRFKLYHHPLLLLSPAIATTFRCCSSSISSSRPHQPPLFTPSPSAPKTQPKFLTRLREEQESSKTCLRFSSLMNMEEFLEELANFKKMALKEMQDRIDQKRQRKIAHQEKRNMSYFRVQQQQNQEGHSNNNHFQADIDYENSLKKKHSSFLNSIDLSSLAEELSAKIRPGVVKTHLVENKIWDTKMERLPLIPFQTARQLVLNAISDPNTRNYFEKFDCKYVEYDRFADVKLFLTNSSATKNAPYRIPIVTIMGHINHGKTTLLDALQQSNIVETEPGLITQSIRAFTIHVGGISDEERTSSRVSSEIPRAEDGTGVLQHKNVSNIDIKSDLTTATSSQTKKKKKKRRRSFSSSDLANSPFKSFFSSSSSKTEAKYVFDNSEENNKTHQTTTSKQSTHQTTNMLLNDHLWKQINQITFIDTPGHRIFAEMRLYGSRLSDVILLMIALDEGVQGQTEEIVRTALHFNKPLVIAFSKVDLFTDPLMLSKRLTQICDELRIMGINVRFVDDEERLIKTLNKMRDPHYLLNKAQNKYEATSAQLKKNQQEKQRMQTGVVEEKIEIDADGKNHSNNKSGKSSLLASSSASSKSSTSSSSSGGRQALAVCISASRGINISLLIRALQRIAGHETLPRASPASKPAQAVVLESFRDFFSSSSPNNKDDAPNQNDANNNNNNVNKKEGPVNIVALIRNGTLKIGTPFVCDMGWGVIDRVSNTWGDILLSKKDSSTAMDVLDEDVAAESLLPGAAVVVYGSKDTTCPGPITHIIAVESVEKAETISKFRNRQRFFIERHPALVHLLRPENKKSEFLHVGNYGQQDPELAYDYNVLVKEAQSPEVKESPLEAQWRANQLKPEEQPKNEEEYGELVKNSRVLTVLVKVDGYNSARTAMREVPKLMTKNVVLNVVSIGFGPITQKDVEKFGSVNVVVLFRAPRLKDPQAHMVMEMRKIKYGEFDVYSEMLEWLKKIVLDAQAEESAKRNPEAQAKKDEQLSILRSAGFLDEKKGKMRTAQQMTPSLEQRVNRKQETSMKDSMFKKR